MKTLKTMNANQKNKSKLVKKTFKILTVIALGLTTLTSCDPSDDVNDAPQTPSIDLKAEHIIFSVDPTSEFAGNATITGNIINIGDDFSSGTGQQTISLYERPLGIPTTQLGNLVASLNFTTLAAGQKLEVSYTRPWNSSSPAEGEFPPEYILVIDFDPDLHIDGNEHNDDSNSANNKIEVSGTLINDMFR